MDEALGAILDQLVKMTKILTEIHKELKDFHTQWADSE